MQSAKNKKWWLKPLVLIVVVALLHLFMLQGYWIENVYSIHIYPVVSYLLRALTGWLPFSIGDVLYGIAFIWLFIKIIQFLRHKPTWIKFFFAIRTLVVKCLWVYIIFLVLWGLNYYRYGIGYQLNVIPEEYSTEDLKNTTAQLLQNLNSNARRLDSIHFKYPGNKNIFNEAVQMYRDAQNQYPYLQYKNADVKQMIAGTIGSYCGFLGYYNPFTGEAQVNTTAPDFVIPFTTCHEMAHQLGYASESEASFIGYLITKYNNKPAFNYSAYFDLFSYANSELYQRDSAAAKQNIRSLDTLVKRDYAVYKKYLQDYRNPIEPLLTKLYGNYLKANNQPKGIQSYDEVVAWVVAYYKKYGSL
ncbi:MAG TPA: DUF3810 domain-containing protein [Parafilimonas sp.]|nr:DUF3810 domain-containing protein [Parafilimonas sp.]